MRRRKKAPQRETGSTNIKRFRKSAGIQKLGIWGSARIHRIRSFWGGGRASRVCGLGTRTRLNSSLHNKVKKGTIREDIDQRMDLAVGLYLGPNPGHEKGKRKKVAKA